MIVLRILGWWILAAAFVAFIVDGTKSIAASTLVITPLDQAWLNVNPPSFTLFRTIVERYTLPVLWDPVLVSVLHLPSWAVLGMLGLLFAFLGRKRTPASVITNQD